MAPDFSFEAYQGEKELGGRELRLSDRSAVTWPPLRIRPEQWPVGDAGRIEAAAHGRDRGNAEEPDRAVPTRPTPEELATALLQSVKVAGSQ